MCDPYFLIKTKILAAVMRVDNTNIKMIEQYALLYEMSNSFNFS